MARSHPPTLLKLVERTLRTRGQLQKGERLLIGVSGGRDSAALLHVLATLAPRLGFSVFAHGIDHGLREEASSELDGAADLADRVGVPFARTRLRVSAGGNLQARAREARYDALDAAAGQVGATRVVTAHHALDRAETVLLRLLRGASPAGLAVLPVCSPARLRPMITAPVSAVVQHVARHRVLYADDPSNLDRRFLRVRVRHEVIPLLEQLSPGIVAHLNSLADDIADPVAPVLDAEGRPIELKRAHREALRDARSRGRKGVRIALPGGVELRPEALLGLRVRARSAQFAVK